MSAVIDRRGPGGQRGGPACAASRLHDARKTAFASAGDHHEGEQQRSDRMAGERNASFPEMRFVANCRFRLRFSQVSLRPNVAVTNGETLLRETLNANER
jgi:hypothetical protein